MKYIEVRAEFNELRDNVRSCSLRAVELANVCKGGNKPYLALEIETARKLLEAAQRQLDKTSNYLDSHVKREYEEENRVNYVHGVLPGYPETPEIFKPDTTEYKNTCGGMGLDDSNLIQY